MAVGRSFCLKNFDALVAGFAVVFDSLIDVVGVCVEIEGEQSAFGWCHLFSSSRAARDAGFYIRCGLDATMGSCLLSG